jgi:hypothetical protein
MSLVSVRPGDAGDGGAILLAMLDEDAIADIEGDADLLLRLAHIDDDEPVDVVALCRHRTMTGQVPFSTRAGPEAQISRVPGGHRVCLREGLLPGRARWLVAHELAELHYERVGYSGPDIEDRCNALGAALVAPRRLVRRLIRQHAHAVHALARALVATQSIALLRLGEVERRPVLLARDGRRPIVRGAAFNWPDGPGLAKALSRRTETTHPLPIRDEERRRGLMAAA